MCALTSASKASWYTISTSPSCRARSNLCSGSVDTARACCLKPYTMQKKQENTTNSSEHVYSTYCCFVASMRVAAFTASRKGEMSKEPAWEAKAFPWWIYPERNTRELYPDVLLHLVAWWPLNYAFIQAPSLGSVQAGGKEWRGAQKVGGQLYLFFQEVCHPDPLLPGDCG